MALSIPAESRFAPAENIRSRQVEGEVVVVNMTSGNYYVLDEVSTFLWRQLEEKPVRVREMLENLLAEYETTPEECLGNIENFCRYMLEEKLVMVKS
ncbi:MAG: PqqD family protein [Bacteriovoracia bacterium]